MCAQKYRNGRNDNKANGICHPFHIFSYSTLFTKAYLVYWWYFTLCPVIHTFLLFLSYVKNKCERKKIENYIFPSIYCMCMSCVHFPAISIFMWRSKNTYVYLYDHTNMKMDIRMSDDSDVYAGWWVVCGWMEMR